MPFYDYQCDSCGHKLEVFQSIKDEPFVKCPNCNKDELKKQISAPAIIFKGAGWTPKSDSNKSYQQYKLPN